MQLDFWFEFGSTYSYPAALRVEELAARHGVSVGWNAFLLGPIFADAGWNDSPFNLYPAKGRYMWRDLERICRDQGIGFRRPSEFPRNGLLAARVACRFADAPWLPDFVRAVYRANFAEDRDISSPPIVEECLACAGEEAPRLLEQAGSEESKARLRSRTEEARGLGIFGAPCFVVDGELFWGNDRLEASVEWLLKSRTNDGSSP
jgi:2-hydroxychromene-2-carboxylate isomerase